jgi:hypothetical protein
MRAAPKLTWFLAAGLSAAGCGTGPEAPNFNTGDHDAASPTPDDVPPPDRDNVIEGTLDGHEFGEIIGAYLLYVDNPYAPGSVPLLTFTDSPASCSDVYDFTTTGAPLPADSDDDVIGYMLVGLNHWDSTYLATVGDLQVATYEVMNHYSSFTGPESGDLVAVSYVRFFNNNGTVFEEYWPEGGELEVEVVDRPDQVSGIFGMLVGSHGNLEGEFNVEECK